MAEIIEIPVDNNTSVSEYTPQQVIGGLGARVGSFILAGLLAHSSRKNENLEVMYRKKIAKNDLI